MGSKNRRRNPGWREFEKLIARIEERFAAKGAVVKSPDRIRDIRHGKLREVDASIRLQACSAPVLITIECRKRSSPQDTVWIEQLAQKRLNLGASLTIAVSSKGFSSTAITDAALAGIQLRTLSEITADDVASWCEVEYVHVGRAIYDIQRLTLFAADGHPVEPLAMRSEFVDIGGQLNSLSPFIHSPSGDRTVNSMIDSWQRQAEGEGDLLYGVEPNGPLIPKVLISGLEPDTYWIDGCDGPIFLRGFALELRVGLAVETHPVVGRYGYSSTDGTICERVETVFPVPDRPDQMVRASLQRDAKNSITAELRLESE